jgi:transposase
MAWRAAAESVGVMTSEATAYRLRRRVRLEGDAAFDDHRHGYAYKLPPAVRQWLATYCQDHPIYPAMPSRPSCANSSTYWSVSAI